ncbi:PTS fructose transporter subunit IIA [Yokenella regensburgei]|uniref:PTS glucitol/sorbitol transporter subunit IIA n=1 Tax=Yokenella regensburgei TaxID=158877 RepID=UPI003F17E948
MLSPLYQLDITFVGEFVAQYLKQDKLILFSEAVPPDIADYCAVHRSGEFQDVLLPGLALKINTTRYRITAVGEVATANLKQLGHITLSFDGAIDAELPGTVHLCGPTPQQILPGDKIFISRD